MHKVVSSSSADACMPTQFRSRIRYNNSEPLAAVPTPPDPRAVDPPQPNHYSLYCAIYVPSFLTGGSVYRAFPLASSTKFPCGLFPFRFALRRLNPSELKPQLILELKRRIWRNSTLRAHGAHTALVRRVAARRREACRDQREIRADQRHARGAGISRAWRRVAAPAAVCR